jgi:hypothetical protein
VHQRIAGTAPYAANRAVAVLSKMFALAIRWGMRADNPARGVERVREHPRERYLTTAELARLGEVLDAPAPMPFACSCLQVPDAVRC